MANRKNPPNDTPAAGPEPAAGRPFTPGEDYGIPRSEKGLLPWAHVSERMAAARYYWISTVSPDARPHATPVDGVWLDDQLYFGGSPEARRNRNLAANPAVCVHLENGIDVVILHGEAHRLNATEHALAVRLSEASFEKYGYGPAPEDYEADLDGSFVFRPRLVFAWKEFPKDVTRWRIG
ncbi:MAG TPA: pyridoxamine 5'-phosphate oxidase family protein [Anaerolineales bacterium]|nr:pyridoxamine 5'-phosphate oxidase family protein [Anaerolineales bacterium]